MNVKKFTAIDLKENINPLDDDEDLYGRQHIKAPIKLSLNTIVKRLHNDGDNEFSDCTIYKVSIPKKVAEAAEKESKRLINYVMVEASLKVFKEEITSVI